MGYLYREHIAPLDPFAAIPPDRLLRVAEVGQLLGYSRATVYRLVGLGKLPVVKVAGTIRFRYQSILRWMADHETPANSGPPDGPQPPTA